MSLIKLKILSISLTNKIRTGSMRSWGFVHEVFVFSRKKNKGKKAKIRWQKEIKIAIDSYTGCYN